MQIPVHAAGRQIEHEIFEWEFDLQFPPKTLHHKNIKNFRHERLSGYSERKHRSIYAVVIVFFSSFLFFCNSSGDSRHGP